MLAPSLGGGVRMRCCLLCLSWDDDGLFLVDLGGGPRWVRLRDGRAGHRVLPGHWNRGRMRSTLIPSASSALPSWLARSLMLPISHSVAGSWSALLGVQEPADHGEDRRFGVDQLADQGEHLGGMADRPGADRDLGFAVLVPVLVSVVGGVLVVVAVAVQVLVVPSDGAADEVCGQAGSQDPGLPATSA